jgi:Cdc6-like AAA superfamily ATPase
MDLKFRIRRRQQREGHTKLFLDYDAISPIAHVDTPTGRGPVLERLLDYLDPVFEGSLPPDTYVWGQQGVGKSALITALFTQLDRQLKGSQSIIHTSTRAATDTVDAPTFVYVDTREAHSDFALYHAILDATLDESVPEKGVGTDSLRSRLTETLRTGPESVIVAVDHVGEPETVSLSHIDELLDPVDDLLSWVAIGRPDPGDLSTDPPPERIEVPTYSQHALVDILTSRATDSLSERAIQHEQMREIATWAEGNAHNALGALFAAADCAASHNRESITNEDLTAGIMDVPRPCASLGRVLTLPDNRKRVLRVLVDLEDDQRSSVDDATDAIVEDVDLSAGTIKRFLYELAESGIIDRVRTEYSDDRHGRPPSRVEPRFPTRVFRRLYDLETTRD